ncbi:GNAT family N-acetyltransferase [Curtobacterium citreum]|uniref:GNAT family N-acetyltransferase n=1 Tax=Curtobacterium citreum TaxID=2036 RepID=UPI002550F73A|nr:GNAT family N-acetyltransferase [Curtobacterium citreum]MDK8174154.1 GNAT family N-acetyltransferase [Curtobacterium citreum]
MCAVTDPVFRSLDGDADVAALQDLLESAPDYTERITGYPPGPSDALSALISVPEGFDPVGKHGWGLFDGDRLVAFADVLLGYPDPGAAFVGLLLVRGDRQGQGLGRALHEAVVVRVRSVPGVGRLRLGIVATNAAVAEPFWRALGYTPTGETKPYRYDRLESAVALWERPL